MSALEAIIMTTCIGLSGNVHDACEKALEAGSKQSGVAQNVGKFEDKVSRKADREARDIVGDTGMEAGAIGVSVVKTVVEKSATFRFPVFMPSMYLSTQIGVEKSQLGIEWKF